MRWPVGSSGGAWIDCAVDHEDAESVVVLPAARAGGGPLVRTAAAHTRVDDQETSSTFCHVAPEPPMRRLASWTTAPGVRLEVEQLLD